ncbi:hypothetical protein K491DRAFT_693172 [Lophiostoma macrostomum CBS 122681]|uniref:Uncharacterized protein n=1 Tax=Lophiostoma macrostomum CBS 122681 TaxID=1314788 RepID=A0A6A6T7F5_9PLEO|nr:hypothetical protein K491DRAFT_693172 [Lophiostoma macrostomum CBS 122681]
MVLAVTKFWLCEREETQVKNTPISVGTAYTDIEMFYVRYPVKSLWVRHLRVIVYVPFATSAGKLDTLEHLRLNPFSGFRYLLHATKELDMAKHPALERFLKDHRGWPAPDNHLNTLWQQQFPNLETLELTVKIVTIPHYPVHSEGWVFCYLWSVLHECLGEHNVTALQTLLKDTEILITARKVVSIKVLISGCESCQCKQEVEQALQGLVKKWKPSEEAQVASETFD